MDDIIKYFVGVDLHKTILQVCVLDSDGEILKEGRFRGGSFEDGLAILDVRLEAGDPVRVADAARLRVTSDWISSELNRQDLPK